MKREILFRGKRIGNGEWVYGFYGVTDQGRHYIDTVHSKISSSHYMIDPETVGQFTGLLDKNKVKIFEDDICKTPFGVSPCNFIKGCFVFGDEFNFAFGYEIEVIGNIHDNPELI